MIKFFCDACGEESDSANEFEYRVHLHDVIDGNANVYVDKDMNVTSGRRITQQLCNKCYNEVLIESVKKLIEIKKTFHQT